MVVAERGHEQEPAAVRVARDQGVPGRPPAIGREPGTGRQPAVGQQLGGLARFGQRGHVRVLDVREGRAGQLRGLALGVAGRCGQRQSAQQRPQLRPVVGPGGHRRLQRRPGLLGQRAQPLGRVQPGQP
jgi:hypothetical protein